MTKPSVHPGQPTSMEVEPVEQAHDAEAAPRKLKIEVLEERLAPGRAVIGF